MGAAERRQMAHDGDDASLLQLEDAAAPPPIDEPDPEDLAAQIYLAARSGGAQAIGRAVAGAVDSFGDPKPELWGQPSAWAGLRLPPPDEPEEAAEEEDPTGMRAELEQLRTVGLQTRCKAEKIEEEEVMDAMDTDDPKAALVKLLLDHYASLNAPSDDELLAEEPEPEPEPEPEVDEDGVFAGDSAESKEYASLGLTPIHVLVRDCDDLELLQAALEAAGLPCRGGVFGRGLPQLLAEGGQLMSGEPAQWRPAHLAAQNPNPEILAHLLELERGHDEESGVTEARSRLDAMKGSLENAQALFVIGERTGWKKPKKKAQSRRYASNLARTKTRAEAKKKRPGAMILGAALVRTGVGVEGESRAIFRLFDADESGELSTPELTSVIVSILLSLKNKVAAAAREDHAEHQDEIIAAIHESQETFDKQIAYYQSAKGAEELSKGFDPDQDGSISEQEFLDAFPAFMMYLTGVDTGEEEAEDEEEEILGEGAIDVSQLSEAAQKRRAKAQAHVEECDAAVAEAEAALAELKEEVGCLDQISTRDARGDRPYVPTTTHTCIWSRTYCACVLQGAPRRALESQPRCAEARHRLRDEWPGRCPLPEGHPLGRGTL